jgi:hypothetical protein
LRLAEAFIGELKKLSRPYFKLSRLVPPKFGGGEGRRLRCQNKINKSFVLSGGRKHDRFASGF